MIYVKNNKRNCETCEQQECFIKTCSKKWRSYASEHKVEQKFPKGAHIVMEGTIINGLYFLSKGKVKVTTSLGSDREKILRFSKENDIIGHRGFETGYQYYIISATTLEETTVCFFETKILYKLMQANAELAIRLFQFYARDLIKTEVRANFISQKCVRERMAIALLELLQNSNPSTKGKLLIDYKLSRQEMADYVSTTRENVSKFLSEFSNDSFIRVNGSEIEVLDRDGLYKTANLKGYDIF